MRLSKYLAAFAIAGTLALAGCATTLSDLAVSTTHATPTQAKTVAEATLALTVAENGVTVYAQSPLANVAVLRQLKALLPPIHNALKRVQVANAAGNSALTAAALTAFNEAWAALQSYESTKGVSADGR